MNNTIYEFNNKCLDFTGNSYLGYKDNKGKVHRGYLGDDIHYLSINPDVVELLNKSDIPKKLIYLKLPFNNIYIPNKLKFKNCELPNGLFIVFNTDELEIEEKLFDEIMEDMVNGKDINKKGYKHFNVDWSLSCIYHIGFYYILDNGKEGVMVFKFPDIFTPYSDDIWEPENYNEDVREMDNEEYDKYCQQVSEVSEGSEYTKEMIKEFPLKEISEFLYKLLLFVDCPDVEIKKTEGRAKKFRYNNYDFFEPKKLYAELSHDLRKYIQEVKRHYGVKFKYNYKFDVRGHFRTMKDKKYKDKKTIWIKPFFKGSGSYINKERIVCRNI